MKPVRSLAIVWFRNDLRLADNPALTAAAGVGPVLPVFICDDPAHWPPGAASKWWLHHSLLSLQQAFHKLGSRLIVRDARTSGGTLAELKRLIAETGATHVFWNRRYEPASIALDQICKAELRSLGLTVESFPGNLLHEPWTVQNKSGRPFQVFTPFWKTISQMPIPSPIPAPKFSAPAHWPNSLPVDDLKLLPTLGWADGFGRIWQPGEAGAQGHIAGFASIAPRYLAERDFPNSSSTSRISPHLAFGEVTPRQVWQAIEEEPYRRQLAWREFAYHLLFHFPQTPDHPLRPEFERFPWKMDERLLKAWTKGQTGYPIVDAGMRELWRTGYMHNRIRLVAASFLVKHLLIPWQEGANWFWDTLVDADLANNTLGWQWVAGCGADAAPYFRIFHPVLQGEKFDVEGAYVRRWVPELAALPNRWIHKPWEAPGDVLAAAGVVLGSTYPRPIVDHSEARERALAAWATLRADHSKK